MNFSFSFNSRETYCDTASKWKKEYAKHTLLVHEARNNIKLASKVLGEVGNFRVSYKDTPREHTVAYSKAWTELERARVQRLSLRLQATEMLRIRAEMKLQAGRQWKENNYSTSQI